MKSWLNTKEAIKNRSKSMKRWWEENRDNPETLKRNKKISKNRKGILHTNETKQMLREMRLGKIVSEETKEAVRKAQTGRFVTDETRKRMSEGMKGKPKSSEAIKKMRIAAIERWKDEEYKKEFSESRQGENNPNYRGGVQYEPYDNNWTRKFKSYIRKRDNQVCMNCGKHREKLNYPLDIHHINYDKQLSLKENCISLCKSCHGLTQINREYWTKLFYDKLTKLYGYLYTEDNHIVFNFESMKGGITKKDVDKIK
jgi:hypothetical protein